MPIMTRPPATRWVLASLALAVLGTAGCTSTSAGSPRAASSSEGSQTRGGTPTSTESAAAKLAATDPCSLLTKAELDRYKLSDERGSNVAGARDCTWSRRPDENGKGGFAAGPSIWDRQGLKDLNTEGHIVTDLQKIGRHRARQAEEVGGNGCFVAIGVTDSSRVDVVVAGPRDEQCRLAVEFAKLIEPKLPGGG